MIQTIGTNWCFGNSNPIPEIISTYRHDDVVIIPTNHHIDIVSSSTHPMVLPSPPDFLVDLQDIVHSPSEETHFLLSVTNVDITNFSLNAADNETLDLMDFENDYDLGF
ncbi:hypothetical protein TSUD_394020 [Trifolium subterraneum]|uniref:Uncharacterized protein n=1 Tax=Trifolium subterraneum TaxID=3900 RepID=A0A2Z6MQ37_TRISU|nr:hypothetical protein TSUD_394020 [Trifolium subterraneum]